MQKSQYDEFGNYIGPEIDEEESDEGSLGSAEEDEAMEERPTAPDSTSASQSTQDAPVSRAVVPHEEKKYYPDAEEVYPEAETLVEEEDTQPLTEPIIAPVKTKDFDLLEKEVPTTSFDFQFMSSLLMYKPELIRNLCLLGHFHHGKTLLMDLLVMHTHDNETGTKWSLDKETKYTDCRKDEVERGLSVKAVPMSLVLQNTNEKSYLLNVMDTPGHVNFIDEAAAALPLCDGAIIVIDALEGVMSVTERLIKFCVDLQTPFIVFINAVDRLILELKLPPQDAFYKLRLTIEEVNGVIASHCDLLSRPTFRVSPLNSTVVFGSALFGFTFTLDSFARMYQSEYDSELLGNKQLRKDAVRGKWMRGLTPVSVDAEVFAKCLWGDIYRDPKTNKFVKTAPVVADGEDTVPRSFVEFILLPLYKIFAHTVAEEQPTLEPMLQSLGVYLKKEEFSLNTRSLLKLVLRRFFGTPSALVDAVVSRLPSPKVGADRSVSTFYSGDQNGKVAMDMKELNHRSDTLMIYTTKTYHRPDCQTFDVLGRVFSGTVHKGQKVKVLGEGFTLEDDEDCVLREVTALWIYEARYRVEVSHVPAGNWVLIGGVDSNVVKTSTITNAEVYLPLSQAVPIGTPQVSLPSGDKVYALSNEAEVEIFRPLKFPSKSAIRVACEPLNPSELPKMLDGLRKISQTYPLAQTKVEESGEHVILGTGELYLDCILHDLRRLYGNLEIKVADPVVQFCETVVETSALKCFAETPNEKNKLYMVVEPLEKGAAEDIEAGLIAGPVASSSYSAAPDPAHSKKMADFFTKKYDWDILAARSIWAFGPDEHGPNILIDDSLPMEVDKKGLGLIKNLVVQGFQWVCREGPLIEESVRSAKFKLLNATVADEPIARSGGQIIPTARRVCYSAFLLASPRLMEPVLFAEIQCPADCVAAVYTVLTRRRGHVAKDMPKPGTPLYLVHAYLPAIESFGFETDLRTHTSGQAFCLSMFDHWSIVPGDPLDKSIILRPLEPAPAPHLAREFLLKTRRRKGLSEDVSIQKFFDDPMLAELSRQEADQFF